MGLLHASLNFFSIAIMSWLGTGLATSTISLVGNTDMNALHLAWHHCHHRYLPKSTVYFYNNTLFRNGGGGAFHKTMGDAHYVHTRFAENVGADIRWQGYAYGSAKMRFNPQIRDSYFLGGKGEVGIFAPKNEYFFVSGASFKDYGNAPAIKGCAACCCAKGPAQGTSRSRGRELKLHPPIDISVSMISLSDSLSLVALSYTNLC